MFAVEQTWTARRRTFLLAGFDLRDKPRVRSRLLSRRVAFGIDTVVGCAQNSADDRTQG
jgi:hypothetical protein